MSRIGPFWALKPIVFKVVCFVLRRRVVKLQICQYMLSPRWNIREVFIKTEFHLARFITPDFLYRQKEICFKSPPARKTPLEGSKPQTTAAFSPECSPDCSVVFQAALFPRSSHTDIHTHADIHTHTDILISDLHET